MAINSHWFEVSATRLMPAKWLTELVERDLKKGTRYWSVEGRLWSSENPDAYAGVHNYDGVMVIFDEASGIDDAIWAVTAGFFTENTPNRFWLAFSNPRRNTGYFYECHNSKRDFWNTKIVDARTVEGTDKAVYPINAMGMSKALMEKVAVAKSHNLKAGQTTICVTRYGNVMASRGSVIPLFISQIKTGKPITITDPDMTRFMMSLDDAVDLVLFAYENGRGGDTFVQKAPAAKIGQLAHVLRKMFNGTNEIGVIGTRHGEKKHECLVNREEMTRSEDVGDFYQIRSDTRDLNYALLEQGNTDLAKLEDYTSGNTYQLNDDELERLLTGLEYVQNELSTTTVTFGGHA
jgi:nucleoside-diphosphate-sugar epimerase